MAGLIGNDRSQRKRTIAVQEALRFKADLHATRFELDSAINCYTLLLRLDSSDYQTLFGYASLLHNFKQ